MIQLVLILAVAFGSPVASCCRLASMVGAGLGGATRSNATSVCCACCEESASAPDREHRHTPPERCECGPARNLFAESHAGSKLLGTSAALSVAPVLTVLLDPEAPPCLVLSDRSHPPPRTSLVALHCALII